MKTTFKRHRHPLVASHNAWTWKFLPGVVIGFALKWWCDNGPGNKSEGGARKLGAKGKPQKLIASKALATDEEYKMVLCVNDALKMGKGKIAAQCAHAAVGIVEAHKAHAEEMFEQWELRGHAKVALRVPTEQEMLSLKEKAEELDIFTYLVVDAGRTQIPSGSRTVLAIGPAPKSLVDSISGHLRLL